MPHNNDDIRVEVEPPTPASCDSVLVLSEGTNGVRITCELGPHTTDEHHQAVFYVDGERVELYWG